MGFLISSRFHSLFSFYSSFLYISPQIGAVLVTIQRYTNDASDEPDAGAL